MTKHLPAKAQKHQKGKHGPSTTGIYDSTMEIPYKAAVASSVTEVVEQPIVNAQPQNRVTSVSTAKPAQKKQRPQKTGAYENKKAEHEVPEHPFIANCRSWAQKSDFCGYHTAWRKRFDVCLDHALKSEAMKDAINNRPEYFRLQFADILKEQVLAAAIANNKLLNPQPENALELVTTHNFMLNNHHYTPPGLNFERHRIAPPMLKLRLNGALDAFAHDCLDQYWKTQETAQPKNWAKRSIEAATPVSAKGAGK